MTELPTSPYNRGAVVWAAVVVLSILGLGALVSAPMQEAFPFSKALGTFLYQNFSVRAGGLIGLAVSAFGFWQCIRIEGDSDDLDKMKHGPAKVLLFWVTYCFFLPLFFFSLVMIAIGG